MKNDKPEVYPLITRSMTVKKLSNGGDNRSLVMEVISIAVCFRVILGLKKQWYDAMDANKQMFIQRI